MHALSASLRVPRSLENCSPNASSPCVFTSADTCVHCVFTHLTKFSFRRRPLSRRAQKKSHFLCPKSSWPCLLATYVLISNTTLENSGFVLLTDSVFQSFHSGQAPVFLKPVLSVDSALEIDVEEHDQTAVCVPLQFPLATVQERQFGPEVLNYILMIVYTSWVKLLSWTVQ